MNRMLLQEDLIRLLRQQQNAQLQPFASVSISSMLGDSLETNRRESNVALHNRATNPIFSAGEATNTNVIEQKPAASGGILSVPCRARGMPKDHAVFKLAHFKITDSIKHGDELVCTHSVCRASGVKFCFCSFCRMPVAKRNFRVRHHHFGEAEAATPLFAPAATASASVASPGPPARSSFTYPSTNTTTNDRDGAGSDKRNLGLVGMVTPSLYSSNRSSGCTTIDSILQEIGLQALLQQSVSMSSGSQSQLYIDTLTRIGAINNTSLLSPRQLLSPHSVASLHQHSLPPAVSAHAAMRLGSNNKKNDVPMDNKMPKPLMTFPCQARGMPADHKRTAHFVIPRNIKHGDSLTCSYAACRDVGVKFYFCVHCNIPVAKRCFRRHHHSEDGAAAVATITNLAHQSSLDNDTSSRTICSSYSSPNPSQAFFELPSSSSGGGGRVDSISALTAPTASPVSQPSKKRPPSSSFDHGSDRHVAKMPKRSDSNFDSCAASSAASSASSSALSSSCKIAMTGDSTITDGPLY